MSIESTSDAAQRWENIYRESRLEDLPWEEGKPAEELVALVESGIVVKGPALDVCCGSGNNAVYLAAKGFRCHGIDISPTAVGYAREKAVKAGRKCELTAGDVLRLPYPDNTFTLVFDRGCFHSQAPSDRQDYVAGIFRVLKPAGKYLLLCFSTKDHKGGPPYAFSPKDIRRYFASLFKIREISELSKERDAAANFFLSVLMEK